MGAGDADSGRPAYHRCGGEGRRDRWAGADRRRPRAAALHDRQSHRRHRDATGAGGRTVEGLENVPATGGAIIAGNHLSVADELFLGSVGAPAHRVLGQVGVLHRQRVPGLAEPVGDGRPGRDPGRTGRRPGRAVRVRRGDPGAPGRRPGRDLPRGHPLAGRPALPRAHRGGPAGDGGRGADHPGRHDRHREGPADRGPDAAADRAQGRRSRFGKPIDLTGRADDRTSLREMHRRGDGGDPAS